VCLIQLFAIFAEVKHGLLNDWDTSYAPDLRIDHLIPASRLDPKYLSRLNRESSRSWVLLLEGFGLNPWPHIQKCTVPLRKMKAWLITRAWKGPEQHINWAGRCGLIEGQASIKPTSAQ